MIRRLILLALLLAAPAAQAARPLHSFTVSATAVGCTNGDYWINVAAYPIGAGSFPPGPSVIVGYDLWSFLPGAADYVMVGKTPPFGDAITHYQYGPSRDHAITFYAGDGFPFDPTRPATEQLHIHYYCPASEGSGAFGVTFFYTLDSDADVR